MLNSHSLNLPRKMVYIFLDRVRDAGFSRALNLSRKRAPFFLGSLGLGYGSFTHAFSPREVGVGEPGLFPR